MSDIDDIDALIRELRECAEVGYKPWRHAALTALVAERDALRIEAQKAKSYWRERAERRDAEQRREADHDLRERLVCAALTGLLAHPSDSHPMHNLREVAVYSATAADLTLAAMRKGATDAK